MSERTVAPGIELAYELDAPPPKVWRALSLKAFREQWLPSEDLAEPEAIAQVPEREISYRMRDPIPPHLESTVTFRLMPNAAGGTSLRISHALSDARGIRMKAMNDNRTPVMLAA